MNSGKVVVQHYVHLWWIGGLEHDLAALIGCSADWQHRIAVRASIEPEALDLLRPFGIAPTSFSFHDWPLADDVDVVVYHNQPLSAPGATVTRRPTLSVYHGFPASRGQYAPHTLACSVNAAGTEWLRVKQGLKNLPSLHPGMEPAPIRKTDYSIAPDRPVEVGCIASGRGEKFTPHLVATLNRLNDLRPIRFCGYGMAPLVERFANCRAEVRLLPPRLGPDKWRFLAGLDVGLYMTACTEGFGIAVQEMLAAGLPVVGDRRGGILDQIDDGRNGLLVSDVPEAFAAVGRLLEDEPFRRRLGEAAAAGVRERYTLGDFAARYAAAFRLAATVQGVVCPEF